VKGELMKLRTLAFLCGLFTLGFASSEAEAQTNLCRNADASAEEGRAVNCIDGFGVMYGAAAFTDCDSSGCTAKLWSAYDGGQCTSGTVYCTGRFDADQLGPLAAIDAAETQISGPASRVSIVCTCQ
jgi:hypothetical protein